MLTTGNQYGNPTAEMMHWVNQTSILDKVYSKFNEIPVHAIDSDTVKSELDQVRSLVEELKKDTNLSQRYKLYDRSLIQYVKNFKFENDAATNDIYQELVTEIFNDVSPLVYKLKLHYQRPRPFQLAALHNVPLYPFASFSAQSPSFPCLHTTIGFVLSHVIGSRITDVYKYFTDLAEDLYHSRLYMGLCLASDTNAGRQLADMIISDQEFVIKYAL